MALESDRSEAMRNMKAENIDDFITKLDEINNQIQVSLGVFFPFFYHHPHEEYFPFFQLCRMTWHT